MSNKVFQQNLDDKKGPQPGGPYLIQMLFKEPVEMPDKEIMTAVMEKHIGSTECFCYDKMESREERGKTGLLSSAVLYRDIICSAIGCK